MTNLEQAARALCAALLDPGLEIPSKTAAHVAPLIAAVNRALDAESGRVSGWQPIETCPDSCRGEYPKYVLYWNGHHRGVGYCYPSEDGDDTTMYVDETGEIITPKPTHWQSLPEPPTDVLAAAQEGS